VQEFYKREVWAEGCLLGSTFSRVNVAEFVRGIMGCSLEGFRIQHPLFEEGAAT